MLTSGVSVLPLSFQSVKSQRFQKYDQPPDRFRASPGDRKLRPAEDHRSVQKCFARGQIANMQDA